jgi:hypothetical protein
VQAPVNAVSDGSWVDALKASGLLIGSVRTRDDTCAGKGKGKTCCDGRDHTIHAQGVAGAMGVLPDEMPIETPPDDLCEFPPPAMAAEARTRSRKAKMSRVGKWVKAEGPNHSCRNRVSCACTGSEVIVKNAFELLKDEDYDNDDDYEVNNPEEKKENVKNMAEHTSNSAADDTACHAGPTLSCGGGHSCHREKSLSTVAAKECVVKDLKVQEQPKAVKKMEAAMQMIRYLGEAREEAALQAVTTESASSQWEAVEVIVDSGAHVSVGPPELGKKAGYAVEESPGSRAGICYTAANGGELLNLGQRFMAVLTEEGTLRGMEQQVANVTKPLEAVRANVRAGHAIVFDDDGTGRGTGSYMINKSTGEINWIHDDSKDYIMKRWIVPRQEVPAVKKAYDDSLAANNQDFRRPSK